jgi:DNA-binding NtrC family response regulator
MARDSLAQDLIAHAPDRAPDLAPYREARSPAPDMAADDLSDADHAMALPVGSTMAAVERELLLQTLAHCDGNRTHAARVLGVSIRTMRNKLRQYSSDGADVAAAG